MKFYLGSQDGLPRYARTQLEAKPLSGVETVDYKTDQAALVERFNELLDQGVMIGRTLGPPADEDAANGAADDQEAASAETEEERSEEAPKPPRKRQPAETYSERSWDQIMVEEFIHAVRADEAYRLDVLETMIASRRAEIARGVGPA